MKNFTLKRIAENIDGVFGVLIDNNIAFAVTLEPPWYNNDPDVSCIPEGSYICKRVVSPKFGATYEITNVPNRTNILFHKGNTKPDTEGCILIGEQFETIGSYNGIISSAKGFNEFIERTMGAETFPILIEKHY